MVLIFQTFEKAEPISRAGPEACLAYGSVIVLDVRLADEFAAGRIPGARYATLSELEQIIPTFNSDSEIVDYCRCPYWSTAHQAVAALRRIGLNARQFEGETSGMAAGPGCRLMCSPSRLEAADGPGK